MNGCTYRHVPKQLGHYCREQQGKTPGDYPFSDSKRAYQLFEQRGRRYGMDFDDWKAAEKQLVADDFSGDTLAFRFVIECPGDPEVTTVLSLTTHSLVVLRSHANRNTGTKNGPEIVSVHVMPKEIDPCRVRVKSVDGLLHVEGTISKFLSETE